MLIKITANTNEITVRPDNHTIEIKPVINEIRFYATGVYAVQGGGGGGGGSNIRKFAMDSVDELICYCGYAPVGSAEDSAVWTITKIVTTVIGGVDNSTTATNWKWTERETT